MNDLALIPRKKTNTLKKHHKLRHHVKVYVYLQNIARSTEEETSFGGQRPTDDAGGTVTKFRGDADGRTGEKNGMVVGEC